MGAGKVKVNYRIADTVTNPACQPFRIAERIDEFDLLQFFSPAIGTSASCGIYEQECS
jgi:hypothetical protein